MYRPGTAESGDKKHIIVIRPSSASAKLQCHVDTSVFDSTRPATAAAHENLSTSDALHGSSDPTLRRIPEDVKVFQRQRQDRRLTLSEVDGVGDQADVLTRLNTPHSTTGKIKVEERITLEQLHQIKAAFEEADTDGSGTLDIDEFKTVVKKSLGIRGRNEEQIIALFMKIDSSSDGEIDWDEFCTYMQLEYAEKEEALSRSKRVMFSLPPIASTTHYHKSPVLRMLHVGDSTFMCCSKEGLLSFWSHDLKLRKSRMISMDQSPSVSFSVKPSIWVTDIAILLTHNKIVIGTGDRDIHFYELSTLDLCCRITGFDSVPLCMDVCEIDLDQVIITYGDDQGCVGIIEMRRVAEMFRIWKKAPIILGMPTVLIQEISCEDHIYYVKWKVHDDWISKLRYYHELHSVVSSCNQTANALVRGCTRPSTALEGGRSLSAVLHNRQTSRHGPRPRGRHAAEGKRRQNADQSVFSVYKGVSTFDFCKERNIIATGGMDRILRLWNPYMPQKPTGFLRGHNSPLVFVAISGADDRVFSVSADKVIRVWDLVEQTCLVTLSPKSHKITGDIVTCTYTEACKAIAVITDHISLLKISQKVNVQAEIPTSHSEGVTCIGYNANFNHVITCSEGSVVKLWDFDNGKAMFEFNKAHGNSAITCMSFDASGRRLVTGGRDGAMRIWNYNNGHCLRTLLPEGEHHEISSCIYLETNKNSFIAGVGWDKKINVYPDDVQDFRAIQRPENKWKDYEKVGHKEDIVAAAYGAPTFLATASYEGLINVWNFVSGHIICSLPYPDKKQTSNEINNPLVEEDEPPIQAVAKLIFITNRVADKIHAPLIAGCTDGSLIFWNIQERKIFSRCTVTQKCCAIGGLVLTEDENIIYIGDALGFVRSWNISEYGLAKSSPSQQKLPRLLQGWRCHVQRITDLCLVENHGVILTSSTDHTVRMWKSTSEYIGTFGQNNFWDLYDETTWCHPMVPQEVLFDPLSMPDHPILKERNTIMDIIHAESREPSDSEDEADSRQLSSRRDTKFAPALENHDGMHLTVTRSIVKSSPRRSSRSARGNGENAWRRRLSRRLSRAVLITPDDICKNEEKVLLNDVQRSMTKSAGKRLRHERLLSQQRHLNLHLDAGSHAFQSLKCFDLQDPSSSAVGVQSYYEKCANDVSRWNKDKTKEHCDEVQSVSVN